VKQDKVYVIDYSTSTVQYNDHEGTVLNDEGRAHDAFN
jgi:hypothetical protein